MPREPKTLKEWNHFRMNSGYILPVPTMKYLYWFYSKFPDTCTTCEGAGVIGAVMVIPDLGLILEEVRCPHCYGDGVMGWYSLN